MAAPIAAPACKFIFEKSNLKHPKSRYKNVVKKKCFNHSLTLVVPEFEKIPGELTSVLDSEPYWIVHQLPLSQLIEREFIEAFLKRGDVYILSHGTRIDGSNCFAVTPAGELILNIDKDTYEELGLEGQLSEFSKKRRRKYVITIQLTAPHFIPGKKNYDRVRWCLTDRLNLKADFIFYWKPRDATLCPSSLSSYLTAQGHKCTLYSLRHRASRSAFKLRPQVAPRDAEETEDHCSYFDFWEWLGAQAVGATEGAADDYVNTLACPSPQVPMENCAVSCYTGMISPHHVDMMIDRCREHLKESASPWVAFTVHGFADSPISWQGWEHGFQSSGDNLYTYLIFPDDDYWLYMSSSTYDTFS